MMSHCTTISSMQGTVSAYCPSFNGLYRKPIIVIEYNKSYSCRRASVKVKKWGNLSCCWIGSLDAKCDAARRSRKARVFDREEAFPPIQTLRRFPVEELSPKTVMVRFDSSILLPQKLDQENLINSSAYFTIKYIHEAGGRIVLMSSWNVKQDSKILSEEAVAEFLSSVLHLKVVTFKHISGHMQSKIEDLEQTDVILLENLSKYKEELANDVAFARGLASGVDLFVNDSFSSVHKILASTVGVTQFCSPSIAGFYFEECLLKLKNIPDCNNSPFIAVVGGGNITEKFEGLYFLASRCDGLIFVGMMAFQVMHALGMPVPLNLVERQDTVKALEVVEYAKLQSIPILLPHDFWCQSKYSQSSLKAFPATEILDGWLPVDLGPNSIDEISSFLSGCKKILWIGPPKFGRADEEVSGTTKLASILYELSRFDCPVTIVGHTACETALRISRTSSTYEMIEHAAVVWEFLKGRNLPGLLALDRAYPFEMNWNSVYLDPNQPLAVDIGSGNGLFLMGMARLWKDLNFLGLEMNEKLVIHCLESVHHSELKNIHFIATNATSSFRSIVSSYPGPVVLVSIQCPNPDFNQPEHRWRMVQRSLVDAIADELAPGGKVFLQSDVKEVAERMRKQFLGGGKKQLVICNDDDITLDSGGWLKENPFEVRSGWERHVLARGAPMYRLMLGKR